MPNLIANLMVNESLSILCNKICSAEESKIIDIVLEYNESQKAKAPISNESKQEQVEKVEEVEQIKQANNSNQENRENQENQPEKVPLIAELNESSMALKGFVSYLIEENNTLLATLRLDNNESEKEKCSPFWKELKEVSKRIFSALTNIVLPKFKIWKSSKGKEEENLDNLYEQAKLFIMDNSLVDLINSRCLLRPMGLLVDKEFEKYIAYECMQLQLR